LAVYARLDGCGDAVGVLDWCSPRDFDVQAEVDRLGADQFGT
jgi:hypothetical protein